MARTIEDHLLLIRDWTDARGCGAWKMLAEMANDAARIAAYDESHPLHKTVSGEMLGGPESARAARQAEKRYRLAAWVLRRVAEGRDEYDRQASLAAKDADDRRIAALPRVDS